MTPDQIKLIHVAAGKARLNRAQYEMMLRNVAGVESCKELTNAQFEDCMAVLEDEGFEGHYWRDKVAARAGGGRATERMIWKITELHAQYEELRGDGDPHYELSGLVARATKNRTRSFGELTPREAWNMIEQIKKMIERLPKAAPVATPPDNDIPF
jgi:hypothetical protein